MTSPDKKSAPYADHTGHPGVLEARIERIARDGYKRACAELRELRPTAPEWEALDPAEREEHLRVARVIITGEGEIEF